MFHTKELKAATKVESICDYRDDGKIEKKPTYCDKENKYIGSKNG